MISEFFHRLLYPAAVLTILITVWVCAWCRSMTLEIEHGYHPGVAHLHDANAGQ